MLIPYIPFLFLFSQALPDITLHFVNGAFWQKSSSCESKRTKKKKYRLCESSSVWCSIENVKKYKTEFSFEKKNFFAREIYCTCNCQLEVDFPFSETLNGQLKKRKLAGFCSYLYLGLSEQVQALSCNTNLCLMSWRWQLAIQTFEHMPTHTTTKFLARHK